MMRKNPNLLFEYDNQGRKKDYGLSSTVSNEFREATRKYRNSNNEQGLWVI